jgi:hypothetical protein
LRQAERSDSSRGIDDGMLASIMPDMTRLHSQVTVERQRSELSFAPRRRLCEDRGHGWPLLDSALAETPMDLLTTATAKRSRKIAKEKAVASAVPVRIERP